jgi:magnesium-transporting ATPase (P-type)
MKSFKEYQIFGREYKVNLWMFRLLSLLIVLFILFIFYQDSWTGQTHGYSVCENTSKNKDGCFNVFYGSVQCRDGVVNSSSPLCTTEHMYQGQILGEPRPWYVQDVWLIVLGTTLFTLLLNTLIFNFRFFGSKPPKIGDSIGGTI